MGGAPRFFLCAQNNKVLVTPKDGSNYAFEVTSEGVYIGLVDAALITSHEVREVFADFDGDAWSFIIDEEVISYDGSTISPKVGAYRFAKLTGSDEYILPMDLVFRPGSGNDGVDTEQLSAIPVVIDSLGTPHVLMNTSTSSKYYGLFAGRNVPGGEGAWYNEVSVPNATACETGQYEVVSFLKWLYDQGLNGQIMFDYD